jgi:patched 1 protein
MLGLCGISKSTIGLELSDVLPEHSAPAAFLKTRDRFFSFYPMNIVLRGEHIDFPLQQHQIDLLRNEIGTIFRNNFFNKKVYFILGHSRFVIKLQSNEPSEHYWLQLFREWLKGMQQRLDDAKNKGLLEDFDSPNATEVFKSPDLQIAISLSCSYGQNYDCARAGQIRLIDESGTINTEGFYNYLYGWHEYEQMVKLKMNIKLKFYLFFFSSMPFPKQVFILDYGNYIKDREI